MDKLREAARQALEALEVSTDWDVGAKGKQLQSIKAITALREALAEQATVYGGLCGGCAKKAADGWALYCVECWEKAEQEPVCIDWDIKTDEPIMGYTAPVRTKDLTDDEIASIGSELAARNCVSDIAFARAVIAADREKNK